MAGPGTTSLVISQAPEGFAGRLALGGVLLLAARVVFALLRGAVAISRWLGEIGIGILTRIMRILLAAISARMILEGITDLCQCFEVASDSVGTRSSQHMHESTSTLAILS